MTNPNFCSFVSRTKRVVVNTGKFRERSKYFSALASCPVAPGPFGRTDARVPGLHEMATEFDAPAHVHALEVVVVVK